MSSPLPDLGIRQLEYVLAVSRSATWAEAAASLGVTPSALSQGLAELERRVGVPIFDREGRRRPIRSSAEPVLDHARQVVALTGDLAAWFRVGHGTVLDTANHFEEQGFSAATGLKKPIDRQAFAVNHMGLKPLQLRTLEGEKWWRR